MSSPRKNLGIVVGVDGSPPSKVAVYWAARDAQLRNLPLTLVHAVPSMTTTWSSVFRDLRGQRARRIIDDAVNLVNESTSHGAPVPISTMVVFGDPVASLVELSRDAEMVAVGSRGRGILRHGLHRSVSSALVRGSYCPVAVIHDEDPLMPHPSQAPVLVGVDGSTASQQAAGLAKEEALRRGVDLVESDESASRLVKRSESAQLVVVGDRNHVGATVAHAARRPVIVAN